MNLPMGEPTQSERPSRLQEPWNNDYLERLNAAKEIIMRDREETLTLNCAALTSCGLV